MADLGASSSEGPFGGSSSVPSRPAASSSGVGIGQQSNAGGGATANTATVIPRVQTGNSGLNFRPVTQNHSQQQGQQQQRPPQAMGAAMSQPLGPYMDGRAQQQNPGFPQHMNDGLRYGAYVLGDHQPAPPLFGGGSTDDYFASVQGARAAFVDGARQGQPGGYGGNPMHGRMAFDSSPTMPSLDFFGSDGFLELPDPWGLEQGSYGGAPGQAHQRRVNMPGHSDPNYGFPRVPINPNTGQFVSYDPSRLPQNRSDIVAPPRSWMNPDLNRQMYWPAPAGAAASNNVASNLGRGIIPKRPGPSSSSGGSEKKRSKQQQQQGAQNAGPMPGESRLKVAFTSLGVIGEEPQRFGTKGYFIPNGLSGSHQVYHQKWRFDITHRRADDGTVVVSWSITALATGTVTERTESAREAQVRQTSGHTICNQVLRQALKSRASELEATIPQYQDNPQKLETLAGLIKALRPKSCILGLLFFGLLHTNVQQRMRELMESDGGKTGAARAPTSTAASTRTGGDWAPSAAEEDHAQQHSDGTSGVVPDAAFESAGSASSSETVA